MADFGYSADRPVFWTNGCRRPRNYARPLEIVRRAWIACLAFSRNLLANGRWPSSKPPIKICPQLHLQKLVRLSSRTTRMKTRNPRMKSKASKPRCVFTNWYFSVRLILSWEAIPSHWPSSFLHLGTIAATCRRCPLHRPFGLARFWTFNKFSRVRTGRHFWGECKR